MGRLRKKRGEIEEGTDASKQLPFYQPIEREEDIYPEEQYQEEYQEEYYPEEEHPYPEERYPKYLERKEKDASAPLAILDEIKEKPSRPGTFKTVIQGKPIDLHSLESYVLKISPYVMRTILRYRTIRTMEEARNVAGRKPVKFNSKTLILILLAVGMAVLGIIFIFFMPEIMQMFKGGL